jgi:hypothetical protein
MLPDLPNVDETVNEAISGNILTRMVDRIRRQRLISSPTIGITDTANGQIVTRVGSTGVVPAFPFGFAVSLNATSVTVAPGKVLTPSWGILVPNNPVVKDWQAETNFVGGVLLGPPAQVWLQIQFLKSDTESVGALGTASIDISGARGGRGGGGGGGAGSGGSLSQPGFSGGGGQDGALGGAGGAGGVVTGISNGPGYGEGKVGGYGGAGGGGGAGGSVTFLRATKSTIQMRRWSISSISLHPAKGTPSDLSSWVHLATITPPTVQQHVAGNISFTPAFMSFMLP